MGSIYALQGSSWRIKERSFPKAIDSDFRAQPASLGVRVFRVEASLESCNDLTRPHLKLVCKEHCPKIGQIPGSEIVCYEMARFWDCLLRTGQDLGQPHPKRWVLADVLGWKNSSGISQN